MCVHFLLSVPLIPLPLVRESHEGRHVNVMRQLGRIGRLMKRVTYYVTRYVTP